jgi:hypothetical protein
MAETDYNMHPQLRCQSCWGLRSTLGNIPRDLGWKMCEECNGTGITPIPICELNNG